MPEAPPPNQAILASGGCVAQKPWVRVTPWPVFSNVQVTVSPFFRRIVTVCVFRSPTPCCHRCRSRRSYPGCSRFVEPPMPVRIHPSCVDSFTVYVPASSVWLFLPATGEAVNGA